MGDSAVANASAKLRGFGVVILDHMINVAGPRLREHFA
jgi:hypothetical protein